jgi:hypothetical protein
MKKTASRADAARIELQLTELRMPTMKLMWSRLAEQADKEGWPAARFLAAPPRGGPSTPCLSSQNQGWPPLPLFWPCRSWKSSRRGTSRSLRRHPARS